MSVFFCYGSQTSKQIVTATVKVMKVSSADKVTKAVSSFKSKIVLLETSALVVPKWFCGKKRSDLWLKVALTN